MNYYSDRAVGPVPRTVESLTPGVWGGIVGHLDRRIEDGSLGSSFPEMCPDGNGAYGSDRRILGLTVRSEIPDLEWPCDPHVLPSLETAFDLVEFVHAHVAKPEQRDWHSFMKHHHLRFDARAGRSGWRSDINRVLPRNGIAFELSEDGEVHRLLPAAVAHMIREPDFTTGDATLDDLLDDARRRFSDRHPGARRDAVEKLWHAFERSKTILDGDKRFGATKLMEQAASTPEFLAVITAEARLLTGMGNGFRIRHSEQNKTDLDDAELDYMFCRLMSLLWLLLRDRPSPSTPAI